MVLCERLVKKALLEADERRGVCRSSRESVFSSEADSILQRWDHLYTPSTLEGPLIGISIVDTQPFRTSSRYFLRLRRCQSRA